MSRVSFVAQTPVIALTGTVAKTILQVAAPTNQAIVIKEWSVSLDGTSPSAQPVLVELMRQTSAGTMTSLSNVKVPNVGSETIQTTSLHTATSEPSGSTVVAAEHVHPQGGYTSVPRFGDEIVVRGGERLGMRVTAPANVDVVGRFVVEE